MNNFQLGIFKAAVGTHTTSIDKRRFMLKLYDTRLALLEDKKSDLSTLHTINAFLIQSTNEYKDVDMPTYYKATIWEITPH